jgi:uncharacterized membrane protein YfcA
MMLDPWTTFPVGILISAAVSAIGLGGGVLWMPFFLIVLKLSPETAVLTSLMIQTAGMGSGSVAFYKQNRIDGPLSAAIMVVAAPGIAAGAFAASRIDAAQMEMILGVMVMLTALLFVSSNQKYDDEGQTRVHYKNAFRNAWVVVPASILNGMLSVSMSEWLIPAMRGRMGLRMSNAIGSCIFIAFGACIIGVAVHLLFGTRPDLAIVLWGAPGVIIGGQIGPRITTRINERLLKEIFIFLLTLVGIHLIYNSF